MKKLSSVLGLVAAAATLTFGLTSAQARPATVAMKDLRLVGEHASAKPSNDIRVIGIFGHGGHHHGGHHYGHGGHYYGHGGHHYGRGGHR